MKFNCDLEKLRLSKPVKRDAHYYNIMRSLSTNGQTDEICVTGDTLDNEESIYTVVDGNVRVAAAYALYMKQLCCRLVI